MKITKDIKRYLDSNYSCFLSDLSTCSKNDKGIAMVTNNAPCYNFDLLSKKLYEGLASVDSIYFKDNNMYLIEFKGGIISKATMPFVSSNYPCEQCNILEAEGYEYVKKAEKEYQKKIKCNLNLKLVESIYLLRSSVIPYCRQLEEKPYNLIFVLVYNKDKISAVDYFEAMQNNLARQDINSFDGLLKKYRKEDIKRKKIFCEDIQIIDSEEFNNAKQFK